jgi:two-component system response regulator HydG
MFRRADGGTLFLDEIGDMPASLQAKLLRALQERAVRPVGGDREYAFDARVIAATNRDLESAVDSGGFREDLFFRLNVIGVEVPPLRARGNDILLLAQTFLQRFTGREGKEIRGLAGPTADKLLTYSWPGNVRELENCLERAVTLARHDHLLVEDLPEKIRDYRVEHIISASSDPADLVSMEEIERRYIRRVMELVGGNKSQAAKVLGFDRKTLYRRLERYDIG